MSTRLPVHVPEAEMAAQRECMRRIAEMPRRPQTYHVVTYGCQMNAHDSEKLAGMLEQMGLTAAPDREQADFVIFNTCCVRDNAERRALCNVTWLKEIRKVRPEMMIAVCGCMIQEPGMAERILKQYPFVDLAFGTANLHRFPSLLERVLTEGQRVVSVDGADVIAEDVPVRRLRVDAAYPMSAGGSAPAGWPTFSPKRRRCGIPASKRSCSWGRTSTAIAGRAERASRPCFGP